MALFLIKKSFQNIGIFAVFTGENVKSLAIHGYLDKILGENRKIFSLF